jgi:threonylcarbamoyladenosine tRNA methylthiotransferase MtaB
MASFVIKNFGCRATQADGSALGSLLARDGFQPADSPGCADLVILNTCTVTSSADDDVRQTVRRVNRENPGARILLTGCYAQRAPEELAALPGVQWVVGNSHKSDIPSILKDHLPSYADFHSQIFVGDISQQSEFLSAPVQDAADRTRPNLKIQDGCNNVCSFCIIPSVRGRSRSAPAEQVIEQVRELSEHYREIVLSGINLGRWGRDAQRSFGARLVNLLRRLITETGVERLRLSSVEPMDLTAELLELMAASPRIARHVHAPLQSGCDATLKRMKRRYRARHYAGRVELARELMPDAGIGADVMVGFPGETEEEFEESRAFIESMPFTYLHVFTYSERPGTPAATSRDQVPVRVRKDRNRVLRELAAVKNAAFRQSFVGRKLSAVTIGGRRAVSTNYLEVELASEQPANRLVEVVIGSVRDIGVAERNPLRVL